MEYAEGRLNDSTVHDMATVEGDHVRVGEVVRAERGASAAAPHHVDLGEHVLEPEAGVLLDLFDSHLGFGRIVALYYRSSTLYRIHAQIRWLYF